MRIPLNQPHEALNFLGAPDVVYEPDGCRISRVLRKYQPLIPDAMKEGAAMAGGVRLSFLTDSTRIAIGLDVLKSGITGVVPARLDILADGERVLNSTLEPLGKQEAVAQGLAPSQKCIDIYLPQAAPARLIHVDIDDGAQVAPANDRAPVWITYGSSITHCGDSDGPSTTWSALVARRLGLNHVNQGFGSNGMMDACSVRTIAEIPAHRISLKLATNAFANTYSDRGFVSAALNMVMTIRDRQPDVPILVVSPFYFPNAETKPNAVGMTIQRMRQLDQEVVELMRNVGDRHIAYLDGLQLFSAADEPMLDQGVHPNAAAQPIIADRFISAAFGPEGFLRLT